MTPTSKQPFRNRPHTDSALIEMIVLVQLIAA